MHKISKAVFPAAGLGTRFLPATKANSKEMLPVVDKPLIQYAAEEAMAAGATELIFITGRNKRSIEDHFDKAHELEAALAASHRQELLNAIKNILPSRVSCVYIRQPEALGLGHAVLCAKPVIGNQAFAVILADDLIEAKVPALKQMTEIYQTHQCSVLGIENVLEHAVSQYGIVDASPISANLLTLKNIIEKPQPEQAPSTLAVVGRYILTPQIFECLEKIKPSKGGEIQLTDGIAALLASQKILAYRFDGKRYDCGSKLGFMQANVELALKHPQIAAQFKIYLQSLASTLN